MSKLEQDAMPILSPMILGVREVCLTDAERKTLTAGAAKTAMVFDGTRHRTFFSASERLELKDRLKPPGQLYSNVFLAQYVGARRLWADFYRVFAPLQLVANRNIKTLSALFCTTVIVGRVAVQVVITRVANSGSAPMIMWSQKEWLESTVKLTPPGAENLWPPRVTLDDRTFEAMRVRWVVDANKVDRIRADAIAERQRRT